MNEVLKMKKVLSIILGFALIAVSFAFFAACDKQNNDNEATGTNGTESGGWAAAESPAVTEEFGKVFEKAAAELDGVDYVPVAYLASQVVAGTNHCVLCKATPVVPDAKTTYAIVYIYEDLEGNAEITEVVSSDADAQSAGGEITGGWAEVNPPEMTDAAKAALEKACETLTGAEYTPVALLATQIVAGTNYRIICQSTPAVPGAESSYVIVTVYADLQGNAEITDTLEFKRGDDYSGDSAESETTNAQTVAAVDGNMKTYYEMSDGTWMCDDIIYQHRLEIKGRMPNAAADTTFVYLSNIEEIPFEEAYKAAGVSSNTDDYFQPEEAVLVEMN